jgi:hypothetical protein
VSRRKQEKRTGAGPLLGELVDEDADAERVRGLGGDEEVVVVVDDEADEDERGHAGDHGEKGFHLGRLPPHPGHHHAKRSLRPPHLASPRLRRKNTGSFFFFLLVFLIFLE